jgi:hypothetical protein
MPKIKTSQLASISIFSLNRGGGLAKDKITELKWLEWDGQKRVVIEVFVNTPQPHIILSQDYKGGFIPIQTIQLSTTNCNFGGCRYWIKCLCGARVAILYRMGSLFLCRHCGDLAYPLQRATHTGRWKGFYKALQSINWMNKVSQTRTKLWKGRLTKRQMKRLAKVGNLTGHINSDDLQ